VKYNRAIEVIAQEITTDHWLNVVAPQQLKLIEQVRFFAFSLFRCMCAACAHALRVTMCRSNCSINTCSSSARRSAPYRRRNLFGFAFAATNAFLKSAHPSHLHTHTVHCVFVKCVRAHSVCVAHFTDTWKKRTENVYREWNEEFEQKSISASLLPEMRESETICFSEAVIDHVNRSLLELQHDLIINVRAASALTLRFTLCFRAVRCALR
jgi:hypothetical protein